MASFMPAAWSPCAMDQAIERLLATPKTTALRPCRSEDMRAPLEYRKLGMESLERERISGAKRSQKVEERRAEVVVQFEFNRPQEWQDDCIARLCFVLCSVARD